MAKFDFVMYFVIVLFSTCAHCVLQRYSIGTTSVQYAHWFLKAMSDEVNQVITAICEEQCMLADKVRSYLLCC